MDSGSEAAGTMGVGVGGTIGVGGTLEDGGTACGRG